MRTQAELDRRLFLINEFVRLCQEVRIHPGNEIIVFKLALEWVLQDLGDTRQSAPTANKEERK